MGGNGIPRPKRFSNTTGRGRGAILTPINREFKEAPSAGSTPLLRPAELRRHPPPADLPKSGAGSGKRVAAAAAPL